MATTIVPGGKYHTREEYITEDRAIRAAMKELEDTTPNLRDYWPDNDRWHKVMQAHRARGAELRTQRERLLQDFNDHVRFT